MSVQFDEFMQEASGDSLRIIAASAPGGVLEGLAPAAGYGDLLGTYNDRAYPETKNTFRLSWSNGPWNAYLSSTRVSSFFDTGVNDDALSVDVSGTSNDIYACSGTNKYDTSYSRCGDYWKVDAMRTTNLTLGYRFENGLRVRGTVTNLGDERAPLADEGPFAFVADQHQDYGKSYSLELYKKF